MKRLLLLVIPVLAILLMAAPMLASAQAAPHFVLGFKAIADQIPDIVGAPLENEHFNLANGNSEQHTTKGLLAWRKSDNFTAFTDGAHTWINGPYGLQERFNYQRFPWENDPVAPAGNDMAPPAAVPAPAAAVAPVPQPAPAPQPTAAPVVVPAAPPAPCVAWLDATYDIPAGGTVTWNWAATKGQRQIVTATVWGPTTSVDARLWTPGGTDLGEVHINGTGTATFVAPFDAALHFDIHNSFWNANETVQVSATGCAW